MAFTDTMEKFFDAPNHMEIFRASARFYKSLTGLDITPYTAAEIDFGLLTFGIHGAILIYLWITRRGFKQGEVATGRFATKREMQRYYLIPKASSFYFIRGLAFFSFALIVLLFVFGDTVFGYLSIGGTMFVFLYYTADSTFMNFEQMKNKKRFYPLGKWNGKKVGLTGGKCRNLFGFVTRKYQRQEHVLIIGPTGKGKTSSYFMPGLIEDACHFDSALVIDIKPEDDIVDKIGPIWNQQGKKVISFNVWKENEGIHFNPLYHLEPDLLNPTTYTTLATLVDTIYRVKQEMVGTFSSDASHFIDQEKQLIHGIMFATVLRKPEDRNLLTVAEALSGTIEQAIDFITGSLSASSGDKESKQLYRELAWFIDSGNMDLKRKAEMLSGASRKLVVFRNPYVRRHLLRPELDLNMFFNEPCLLVIKAPLAVHTDAVMLASMITRLLMVKIYQSAPDRLKRDHNIWLYLDELPSLKIPDLSNFVATVRSSGGGVVAAIQEKMDLHATTRSVASANSAEALETNFGTTVLLPGCHPDTCERVVVGLGDKMVLDKSKIQDVFQFINFRSMRRYIKAPLVTIDALKNMEDGQAFVYPNSKRSFFVRTMPYYANRRYKRLLAKLPKVQLWRPDPNTNFEHVESKLPGSDKIDANIQSLINPPEQIPQAPINSRPAKLGHTYEDMKQKHDAFKDDIADQYNAQTDYNQNNHKGDDY